MTHTKRYITVLALLGTGLLININSLFQGKAHVSPTSISKTFETPSILISEGYTIDPTPSKSTTTWIKKNRTTQNDTQDVYRILTTLDQRVTSLNINLENAHISITTTP
jgi:hypothetical protein